MNKMCLDCPRYDPETVLPDSKAWYTSKHCPGSQSEVYTGCIRKPWNPQRWAENLEYDLETETWKPKKEAAKG